MDEFFPYAIDSISKGVSVQKSKEEVTAVISHYKNGYKSIKRIYFPAIRNLGSDNNEVPKQKQLIFAVSMNILSRQIRSSKLCINVDAIFPNRHVPAG